MVTSDGRGPTYCRIEGNRAYVLQKIKKSLLSKTKAFFSEMVLIKVIKVLIMVLIN